MSYKSILGAAALMATLGFSAQADAPGNSSSTTIRLRAVVPIICHVQMSEATGVIEDGVADLGSAREFCNAPRGYRVIVRHPTDLEGAVIIKDGERIPLSAGGETVLTDSHRPDIRSMRLAVETGDAPERFTFIGVNIEARA
jgi:hypothetical protein